MNKILDVSCQHQTRPLRLPNNCKLSAESILHVVLEWLGGSSRRIWGMTGSAIVHPGELSHALSDAGATRLRG